MTKTYEELRTLFSERDPFSVEQRLGGDVISFDPIYIKNLREAFSTGCMMKMSEDGYAFTNDYINYVDGLIDETLELKTLDTVLVDIVNCTYVPTDGACTINSVYEFNECGV